MFRYGDHVCVNISDNIGISTIQLFTIQSEIMLNIQLEFNYTHYDH